MMKRLTTKNDVKEWRILKKEQYITYDAVELAGLIRAKEVKSSELVQASIDQYEAVNGTVNAVVHHRFDRALHEADRVEGGQLLTGVPFLLKDISQSLQGERITSGSRLFSQNKAPHTSHFVRALQKAGLIFTGFTNTPEFALKNITEPKLFGPSRNPWNLEHTPGGSSGGATAAVASGIVPAAGASDGGGSIRIPASFTGLFGLKPTRGRTAVGPGVGRNWQGAAVDFVVSRSVRDSAALLDATQTVQQGAAFHVPLYEPSYLQTLKRLPTEPRRIAYSIESPVGTPVSEDARNAVFKVLQLLERNGHIVEEVDPNIDGVHLMQNYYLMNSGEMASVVDTLETMLNRPLRPDEVELETWMLAHAGEHVSAKEYAQSLNAWDQAAIEMAHLHETYDFYITPTTAHPAPKVGELSHSEASEKEYREKMERATNSITKQQLLYEMFEPSLAYSPFTQLANLTGQPAISLPVHVTAEGLPIGVQVMASKGHEHRLLQLASFVESSDIWVGQKGNPYFE